MSLLPPSSTYKASQHMNWKTKTLMTNIIDSWACLVTFSKVLTVHLPLMEIKTHFSSSFWLKFFLEPLGAERFNTGRRKEAGAVRWRTKNKCITLWQSWPGYNSYQGCSPTGLLGPSSQHVTPAWPLTGQDISVISGAKSRWWSVTLG